MIAVLSNKYLDEFETGRILSDAWYEAKENNLEPDVFFKKASRVASPEILQHGRSGRDVLRNFEPGDW